MFCAQDSGIARILESPEFMFTEFTQYLHEEKVSKYVVQI